MSDRFQPISMEALCDWAFGEWKTRRSLFGIPEESFFRPREDDPFRTEAYRQVLETPFGVAAGPHSQMAQNILVAWLCGARFIELKTVQTLDELEVSKPCIDMQDVGYNVEWSQELKVNESIDEYVRAWVLIHVFHKLLGFPGDSPGVVFNMSVGYDMKGILQPNVQHFLDTMDDAGDLIRDCMKVVAKHVPEAADIAIPSRLSDSVTLSTMHGCPPHEIGTITKYLIRDRGLHTSVKLNPTLLGPTRLREILNEKLGFKDVTVPDAAFEHDLKYNDAVPLLRDLMQTASESGVIFGVKLTNTLEVENHRPVFPENEKMMYLSGRALHALTVNLASLLDSEFAGLLMMSFAGGADAFNAPKLLAGGMETITVCSDLLRSGGYMRMLQYIEETRKAIEAVGADNLNEFCCKTATKTYGFARSKCASEMSHRACPRLNLKDYASAVLHEPEYLRDSLYRKRTKTVRPLHQFDCIKAPCTDDCPIDQKVPEYMNLVREGRWAEAARITREDNPLPSILGRVCDHLCENVCIRTHYDKPLAIKEIKRSIMEREKKQEFPEQQPRRDEKIAVIGAGPCGLSIAYFMSLAGYQVELFEAQPYAGGMVSGTIPVYRSAPGPVEFDMETVLKLGAKIHYGCKAGVDITLSQLREQGFAAIVIAVGAQRGGKLGIDGEAGDDVYDALTFLRASREGHPFPVGKNVAVIGGGDVAMDCARSAVRLGASGTRVVYRRTIDEMPASRDELLELLEEEIPVIELAAPKSITRVDGKVTELRCSRMKLGEPDESGRRRPVEIPDSEFGIPVDQVILAVSQSADLSFFDGEKPNVTRSGFIDVNENMETSIAGVYAGGDVGQAGPSSIVSALGDGRKIALAIRRKFEGAAKKMRKESNHGMAELDHEYLTNLLKRRATREQRVAAPVLDLDKRENFDEVVLNMSDEEAQKEAARCLDCHKLCSLCVGVCPNLALFTYKNDFSGTWSLPNLKWNDDKWNVAGEETVTIAQRYQVAVLTDFCNECGNCVTFCPAAGRPYVDKPRIYVNKDEFEAERDNAYRITRNNGSWSIDSRNGGETYRLTMQGSGELELRHPGIEATLDSATLELKEVRNVRKNGTDELSLAPVAGMWVLLNVFKQEMPYYPIVKE